MSETFTAKVTRGAKLLDKVMPGWEGKINLHRLNLGNCLDCILGQLYGTYDKGVLDILPGDYDCVKRFGLGFSTNNGRNWVGLTRVWGRLILKRLARLF